MEFERSKRRHTHINIAPLVDVVFLLLLFFLLTYHVATEQVLSVDLPEAETGTSLDKEEIVIVLSADGRVVLGDKTTPIQSLSEQLVEFMREKPGRVVQIKSDKAVSVELLVQAVDAVKKAGGRSIQLITREKADK